MHAFSGSPAHNQAVKHRPASWLDFASLSRLRQALNACNGKIQR